MKTIWKYELPFEEKFEIEIPEGAIILCVQRDEKTTIPCIWCEVNPYNNKILRTFELFGTGHEMPVGMGVERKYIGTYQYQRGQFVGHVYERIN